MKTLPSFALDGCSITTGLGFVRCRRELGGFSLADDPITSAGWLPILRIADLEYLEFDRAQSPTPAWRTSRAKRSLAGLYLE